MFMFMFMFMSDWKMKLNQLYGYFGRSQDLIITQNVNKHELDHLLLTRMIENIIQINHETYLVFIWLKVNLLQIVGVLTQFFVDKFSYKFS